MPSNLQTFRHPERQIIWQNTQQLPKPLSPEQFDPDYWQSSGQLQGEALGRGTVWRIRHQDKDCLLRLYRRGGWIGQWNRRTFFGFTTSSIRSYREMRLLQELCRRDLPVPQPLAAWVRRRVGLYQTAILLETIPHSANLTELMRSGQTLTAEQWQHIGATIRRFHDQGLHHADLNSQNILLDAEGQAWLIDFDRSRFRSGEAWKAKNLDRLLRSLRKNRRLYPNFTWREEHWSDLCQGYR